MKCSESLVRPTGSAHAIGRRFVAVAATALLMLLPGALPAQVEGGPKDGGAWRAGDFWRFNRQFQLRLDDIVWGTAGSIVFNERFTKTVDVATPVIEASNSLDGPQRVYLRNRSAGTVTGDGVWFLPTGAISDLVSASILYTVLPGATSSGFDWRRVSDLAHVRESFTINGTIRARVSAFTTLGTYYDNANMQLAISVTIDNGPAIEYADFPLEQIGEQWIMLPTRRLSGSLTVGHEDVAGGIVAAIPATTITYPLDTTAPQTFIQNYAATGVTAPLLAGGTFPNTERIDAAGSGQGDTLHWSGTAKEFVDHATGTSPILMTLYNFRTSLSGTGGADYGVTPDSAISNVAFTPMRPVYGSPFQMSFTGGPADIRLRDHAGNEQFLAGATSPVVLAAPGTDDDSPTSGVNPDLGSYGIEFIVGGNNVELATVRLSCIDCPFPIPSASATPTLTPMVSPTPTVSRTPTPSPSAEPSPTPVGPGNDHFVNRYALNGTQFGTNAGATMEPGEPDHDGYPGGASVWWQYDCGCLAMNPYTTVIRITAEVSGAWTLLAVYSGSAVSSLTVIASSSSPPGNYAEIYIVNPPTTSLKIAVDSIGGEPGPVTISVSENAVTMTSGPSPTPPNPSRTPTRTPTPTPSSTPTPAAPSPSPAVPSPSPTPVCCPGDADNSGGSVNAQDFLAVQAAFGMDNGTGGFGDADCSGGAVNAQDFLAVQANFGASCGA